MFTRSGRSVSINRLISTSSYTPSVKSPCVSCSDRDSCYYYIGKTIKRTDGLSKLSIEVLKNLALDTTQEIENRLESNDNTITKKKIRCREKLNP